MSYIGNSPGVASQRVTTTLTATAGQTQFTTQSGYVLGYVDAYLNGAKLVNGSDFEAITGTYITLFAGAAAGDVIELISYVPRGLSDGYTKAEADAKFLDVGGDTASGSLALAAASLTGNLTLSGGTANGVGYLNGSKVLTTGSALTFDGTNFATTGIITAGSSVLSTASGNTARMIAGAGGTYFGSTTAADVIFQYNQNEGMRLTSTGLGLGTNAPAAKLVSAGSSATNFKALILRNGDGTTGSSASIDFEASTGTQGDEASMAGRIAGIRAGSGTTGALSFSTTNAGVLGERARIDNAGRFNLGTQATTVGFSTVVLSGGPSTNNSGIQIGYGASTFGGGAITTANAAGGGLTIWTYTGAVGSENYTRRLDINSSGNLLIGTTTDAGKLTVSGKIRTLGGDIELDSGQVTTNSDVNPLKLGVNGVEKARLLSTGNFLIGSTSAPGSGARLVVAAESYPSTTEILADFRAGTTTSTTERYVLLSQTYTGAAFDSPMLAFRANGNGSNQSSFGTIRTAADGALTFSNIGPTNSAISAATEKVRITSAGNVGLGTSAPRSRLEVSATNASIILASSLHSEAMTDNQVIGSYDFYKHYAIGRTAGIRFLHSGGPGNYANTHMAFHVSNGGNIYADPSYEAVRITDTGRVGIATTGPQYKLDVNGAARVNGLINTSSCYETTLETEYFTHGVSNLAVDLRFGNTSFWGYVEIEISGTFSNQNVGGKLSKTFAVGTNPNNAIYVNEGEVTGVLGPISNAFTIGNFGWDAANSTYRVPIYHLTNLGNSLVIKVRQFVLGNATGVFNALSVSGLYTSSAIDRIYGENFSRGIGIGGAPAASTGSGISFPSSQAQSTDPNTLDDYEEGTWNPTPGGLTSINYSDRQGTYVKVGKIVTVFWDFTIASSSGSGNSYLYGLPFPVSSSQAGYSVVNHRDGSIFATGPANTVLKGFAEKGQTYIYNQLDYTGTSGFATQGVATYNNSGRHTGFCTYTTQD